MVKNTRKEQWEANEPITHKAISNEDAQRGKRERGTTPHLIHNIYVDHPQIVCLFWRSRCKFVPMKRAATFQVLSRPLDFTEPLPYGQCIDTKPR